MSGMYGKSQAISTITNDAHKKSIMDTADVPKCTKLVVGVIDQDATKTEHEDYTVAYIEYEEGDQTIYFDGSAWVEAAPTIANLKTFQIK